MGSLRLPIASMFCAVALAFAPPAASEPAPAAGAVSIEMSLEAARAAAPQAKWHDELSPHTGKVIGIAADEAWTLEGQSYHVTLRRRSFGAGTLLLDSRVEAPDFETCRARVVAIAAHFDATFDALKTSTGQMPWDKPAGAPAPTISVQRTPGGYPYVTAQPNFSRSDDDGAKQEVITVGRNARVGEVRYESGAASWNFGQPPTKHFPYSIEAEGDFAPGARPGCSITATIHSFPPDKPAFQMLDSSLAPVKRPSVGPLHHSLDGVDLPAESVSLPFRCEVSRVLGNLFACISEAGESNVPSAVGAARKRLNALAYDPKQLDADNDVPLYVDVAINLSRTDRRTAEPPPDPGSSRSPFGWAQTATPADLSRVYPAKALRQGLEGRVVANCRVEADLSLVCFGLESDPSTAGVFDAAVYQLLLRYRAQAKAEDGSSAVGRWVKVPVLFKLVN